MKIKSYIPVALLVVMLLSACEYQKLLKSKDYGKVYTKAVEYYNSEDYAKAISLFDQLIPHYRHTEKGEQLHYLYAQSHFKQNDYILAGHYFRNFAKTYGNSEYAEEAEYLGAYCYYMDSPRPTLDQSNTFEAIKALQMFINKYPNSERIKQCNKLIDNLRHKLEKKAYLNAKLYYDLEYYQAAIVSLKNSLVDYPDSKYREDILFMVLEANYLYAKNSVEKKQHQRYENTIAAYKALFNEYPESKYTKEANKIYKTSLEEIKKEDNELETNL